MDCLPQDIWCPFCHKEETCSQMEEGIFFCRNSQLTFSVDDSNDDKAQTHSN